MDIEAISGAATVALTSTVLFLLVAKSWNALSRTVGSTPNFAESIMQEAAQRFRDELDRLSSSQSTYLSGALYLSCCLWLPMSCRPSICSPDTRRGNYGCK